MSALQQQLSAARPQDLDVDNWVFKPPVVNTFGAPRVDIKGPTTFQVPLSRTPFGVSHTTWDKKPVTSTRKNMEMEMSDPNGLAFFQKVDEKVIATAQKHPEWFKKKKISRETVETLFRRCVQPSKGDYPPLVRIKVVEGEGEHNDTIVREVYTADGDDEESYDIGDWYSIKSNTDVIPIVKVNSLWFVGGNFGVTILARDVLAWTPKKAEDTFPYQLPFNLKKRKRGDDDDERPPNKTAKTTSAEDKVPFNGGLGDAVISTPV